MKIVTYKSVTLLYYKDEIINLNKVENIIWRNGKLIIEFRKDVKCIDCTISEYEQFINKLFGSNGDL